MSHTVIRVARFAAAGFAAVVMAAGGPILAAPMGGSPGQTPAQGQAATPATADQSGPTLQLTMQQAEQMALETNLGLKSQRLNADIAAENIASARAAFAPQLTSSFSRSTAHSVPQNFTDSTADVLSSSGLNASSRFSQALPWLGSSYSVNWSGSRSTTTGYTNFNPRLGSSLQLAFAQPLWQGLRIDSARAGLEASERQRAITDLQVQEQTTGLQIQVRLTYLNLVGAMAGLDVAKQNLAVAQQQLDNTKARVQVGVSPDIDVVQFEALVASNQESVIVADAAISTAEDQLRSLIMDPAQADYWQVHIQPTDTIVAEEVPVDAGQVVQTALANRLDLTQERRQLEITDLNLRLGRDLTKPAVDFTVNYAASGTAGTQLELGTGFPPTVLSRTARSFGSALSDTFGGTYPSWTVGMQFSYPIGRSSAEASVARSELQRQQAQLSLRQAELQVVAEVRDAVRQVQTGYKRVEATRVTLQANERQLEAEQRKLAVGLSTTFELSQRQRDLAQARTSELNARIAYNRALIELERVQKIR